MFSKAGRQAFLACRPPPFVLIALAWQAASAFFPPFLFPGSLIDVFGRVLDILTTWSQFSSVLATAMRILGGLAGAFVLGAIFGLTIYNFRIADRLLTPTLIFFQGIPALSWVVFAIIWFHGVEFRILFIMIMTTLPAFTFQVVGALRGDEQGSGGNGDEFPSHAEEILHRDGPALRPAGNRDRRGR